MAKYLYIYHGGKEPESEEEGMKVMQSWMTWIGGLGDAVVDGGNPLTQTTTLHADGSTTPDGGANPVTGYSLVNADDMKQAVKMAKGCPIFDGDDNASVEIAETLDIDG